MLDDVGAELVVDVLVTPLADQVEVEFADRRREGVGILDRERPGVAVVDLELEVERQLGVIVPIASQIDSERDKWGPLARPPLFAAASPYSDRPEALLATGERLQAEGAEAVLLDCIGFTEQHRDTLAPLDMPVILSNAVAAKALSELLLG